MYLCHSFCELGATPLAAGLEDIHQFLATHPAEVVVVVNQDYVTPADFVEAVGDAGLTRYVFKGLAREPVADAAGDDRAQPAARAAGGERAGAAPWYQLAYERLMRGDAVRLQPGVAADRHAHDAARPTAARRARRCSSSTTGSRPIRRRGRATRRRSTRTRRCCARARACERIRDHLPNLLAVNFYKRGDLFRVVDELNGIRAP